jgi:hypothetical protein
MMKWCYATYELSIPLAEFGGVAAWVGVDCGDTPIDDPYNRGGTRISIADPFIY